MTGANSGLGFETARALAAAGAEVVLACRSEKNAQEASDKIHEHLKEAKLRPLELDLDSLESVRAAANKFLSFNLPLHFLILNAGIMATPNAKTKDGFERQLGVNHLSHFLLTELLLPKVKESAPSRVITLSSRGHYLYAPKEGFRWDDLAANRGYDRWERYGQSKLANILHMEELQRRLDAEGVKDVICVSVYPGAVYSTGLFRQKPPLTSILPHLFTFIRMGLTAKYKTIEQGSSTTVYCALSPDVVKGEYYADCGVERDGYRHGQVSNQATAKRLWEESVKLVGLGTPEGRS